MPTLPVLTLSSSLFSSIHHICLTILIFLLPLLPTKQCVQSSFSSPLPSGPPPHAVAISQGPATVSSSSHSSFVLLHFFHRSQPQYDTCLNEYGTILPFVLTFDIVGCSRRAYLPLTLPSFVNPNKILTELVLERRSRRACGCDVRHRGSGTRKSVLWRPDGQVPYSIC